MELIEQELENTPGKRRPKSDFLWEGPGSDFGERIRRVFSRHIPFCWYGPLGGVTLGRRS